MFVEKITLKYFLSDKILLMVIYNDDDWEIGSMFTKNRGAYSEEHEIAVLITAYIPDPEKWLSYKIRKPKR